jgi:hypothetical protein
MEQALADTERHNELKTKALASIRYNASVMIANLHELNNNSINTK